MFKFRRSAISFAAIALILLFLPTRGAFSAGLQGKLSGGSQKTSPQAQGGSVLPKTGDIAVVVDGDEELAKTAEAMIIETLVGRGHRVVDEAKMKKIRAAAAKEKAARLALEGNVEAILKINANYSAAATLVAHVQVGQAVQNEFQLFTGTASIALMAVTSNGTKLGGRTSMGKEVGYTDGEALYRSVAAAVEQGMSQF